MTVIEPSPEAHSSGEGERGLHSWSIPRQGSAPYMDDSALPADHEPDAIVMRLESVSMPAQAPFDASTPWPVQPQAPARAVPDQQTPLRVRVARVRKVVVASDCIILAGLSLIHI